MRPTVLFIPHRFMDHRMWFDIPDRLEGRAEVVHVDRRTRIRWNEDGPGLLESTRRPAADGGGRVVAAAGEAARFGFALAEAGQADGLVLFEPRLDRLPDDTDVDVPAVLEQLGPYEPIVSAVDEPDPAVRRDTLLAVLLETAGPHLEPAQLAAARDMTADHAEDYFAHLQDLAATADGPPPPDPPWIERPWIDRLGGLSIPVTVVDRRGPVWATIARRARDAELVEAAGAGFGPARDRARSAHAVLRALDRIG